MKMAATLITLLVFLLSVVSSCSYDATDTYQRGYDLGYTVGAEEGRKAGEDAAKDSSYKRGYQEGYEAGFKQRAPNTTPTLTSTPTPAPTPTRTPTPTPTNTATPVTTPKPTSIPIPSTKPLIPSPSSIPQPLVSDIAYIKLIASCYSDDADPEYDGINVSISFYDRKSESYTFSKDITFQATVKLWGDTISSRYGGTKNQQLIYSRIHTINISNSNIRIPYSKIPVNQKVYAQWGSITVTAEIPGKGTFEAKDNFVFLYP